jgi:hypothetical protein
MKRTALIMVILLLASIPVSAQGTARIQRHVIASGGSTNGRLVGAMGQPMAGTLTAKSTTLCSGFWCPGLREAIVQAARILYRLTFGNIGVMVVASALAVLVALRKLYDVTFNLWRANGRSIVLPVADSAPSDRGRAVFRDRPVRPVVGPNRHRRKHK